MVAAARPRTRGEVVRYGFMRRTLDGSPHAALICGSANTQRATIPRSNIFLGGR
jgi:hypothetical protein